jgi:integrase
MPVYKDQKRKTWTVKFKYKDWRGKDKWLCKRGFVTKREALVWEANYKLEKTGDMDMIFSDFVERYKKEIYPRIKISTSITKSNIIDALITPYFGDKKVVDINKADVIQWQNNLISYRNPRTKKPLSKSYLKTIHNQLSAIFNYAVKFFDLKENPAAKVGNMGSDKEIQLNFWTKEEYLKFAEVMMEKPFAYYCFETLYWTGMRSGEMLALTLDDIDFERATISISKTHHRIKGEDIITSPKTPKGNRKISIPEFLLEELKDYIEMIYNLNPTDRLFPTNKAFLGNNIHAGATKAGVKQIRVHDLRHSHVSLLIDMGYSAVAIAERVGHESVDITYRYAHMFPSVQKDMAEKLNKIKGE